MILRNLYNMMLACWMGTQQTDTTTFGDGHINFKDETGTLSYFYGATNSHFGHMGTNLLKDDSFALVYGIRKIRMGTGNTPVTFDDYQLANLNANISINNSTMGTPTYDSATRKWAVTWSCQLTNNSTETTIREIGIAQGFYYTTATPPSTLIYREVLDTPFTIASNDTVTYTHTFEFTMPTVLSTNSGMVLRNYYNMMLACWMGTQQTDTTTFGDGYINFKDKTGTLYGIKGGTDYSYDYIGSNLLRGYVYDSNYGYRGIYMGTGNTPVTFDDYTLSNEITTSDLAASAISMGTPTYDSATRKWAVTWSCVLFNQSSSNKTISEIGIFQAGYPATQGGRNPALIYREVLTTPFTLAAYEAVKYTHTFEFTMPTV